MSTQLRKVNRGTAVATRSLNEVPINTLLRDDVNDGAMLLSFQPGTDDGESLLFATDGEGTREWTQHIEHPFMLHQWAAKRIELSREGTDDTTVAVRITLIDPDRETLSFVSAGIMQSLDLVRATRGDGPYEPAIPVTFRQIKTRKGFNTLKFSPVVGQPATKAKK